MGTSDNISWTELSLSNQTTCPETETSTVIFSMCVIAPGALANMLAVYVFRKALTLGRHSVVNTFLFFNAINDFLGSVYAIYSTLSPFFEMAYNQAFLVFATFAGNLFALVSAFLAFLLALDRYFALCFPFQYENICTKSRAYWAFVVAVFLSFGICSFNLFGLGDSYHVLLSERGHKTVYCTMQMYEEEANKRLFGLVFGSVGLFLISSVLFCNVRVTYAVLKMRSSAVNVLDSSRVSMKVELKFAKVIAGLSLVVLVCWGPFMMVSLLIQTGLPISRDVKVLTYILASFNYVIDPFVFAVMRKAYRQAARRMLECRCCCTHRELIVGDVVTLHTQSVSENQVIR